jgi:hypothetical protein
MVITSFPISTFDSTEVPVLATSTNPTLDDVLVRAQLTIPTPFRTLLASQGTRLLKLHAHGRPFLIGRRPHAGKLSAVAPQALVFSLPSCRRNVGAAQCEDTGSPAASCAASLTGHDLSPKEE